MMHGESVYDSNLRDHLARSRMLTHAQVLSDLTQPRMIEFWFCCPNAALAIELEDMLKHLGCPSIVTKQLGQRWMLEGVTELKVIDPTTLSAWIHRMCELGASLRCLFDGWEIRT